jgi:hypothetical protein
MSASAFWEDKKEKKNRQQENLVPRDIFREVEAFFLLIGCFF